MTLFLISLLFLAVNPSFSYAADEFGQEDYSNVSQQDQTQQGEVLGVADQLLGTIRGFFTSSSNNLFKWGLGKIVGGAPFGGFWHMLEFAIFENIVGFQNTAPVVLNPADSPSLAQLPAGAVPIYGTKWYFSGGVVPLVNDAIASIIFTPSASGVYYAYDTLNNLGIRPAYAASGIGFPYLHALLSIWKAFRNIAYGVFAIVFIVTGLMVMFRIKVSAQAVLTMEQALPKMVGVLILITFSYAIAGFMIDLMYVIMGLGVWTITGSASLSPALQNVGGQANLLGIFNAGPFWLIGSMVAGVIPATAFIGVLATVISGIVGLIVGGPVGALVGVGGGSIGGTLLISVIFAIIILIMILKLFWALIKTYFNILMLIIFSPLQILVGAIPGGIGNMGGFGKWITNLAANLLVFPAVAFVVLIAHLVSYQIITSSPTLWAPPFLNVVAPVAPSTWLIGIVGLGMLFILPGIPDTVRNAFGVKQEGSGFMGMALAPVMPLWGAGKNFIGNKKRDALNEYEAAQKSGKPIGKGTQTRGQIAQAMNVVGGLFSSVNKKP